MTTRGTIIVDEDNNEPLEGTEPEQFEGVYIVDDETLELLTTAVGCLGMLSQVQLDEAPRENLLIIADELAARFGLSENIEVEEQVHTTEDGEEIIYRPKGGVMGDEPEEAEGPAPEQPQSG